jgi:hypothetical protein
VSLRDQLQAIYDEHGRLTPGLVVDAAKKKSHPLHERYFALPDREAAYEYRKVLAAKDIRSVTIVYREADESSDERRVRAFHAVRDDDGNSSYEPVEKVVQSPFLTRLLLADMEREWRALRRRYEQFEEFWQMVSRDADAA